MEIYIKNKIFLEEVDSLSQRGILTLNKFSLRQSHMRGRKNMWWELKNTILKYKNASTQSRAIKNTKTHKPIAKLQEKKNLIH